MRLAVRALPRPRMRRRITVGTRTRILASYVVLLGFSALLAVLVIGRVLDARVEDRVLAAQRQEVDELRLLARDCRVPTTGRACPDLQTIFDVFLARNIPAARGDAVRLHRRAARRHRLLGERRARAAGERAAAPRAGHALGDRPARHAERLDQLPRRARAAAGARAPRERSW